MSRLAHAWKQAAKSRRLRGLGPSEFWRMWQRKNADYDEIVQRLASERSLREKAERRLDEAHAGWQRCAADLASETARANENEVRAETLTTALRNLADAVTAYGEKIAGPEPRGPWPIWPVAIRDALIAAARSLSASPSTDAAKEGA